MKEYYAWVEGRNIVISLKKDMVPTGDAFEYEMSTSHPYIDKLSTLIKIYGNGSKPLFQYEIDNEELYPHLSRDGRLVIFQNPSVASPGYIYLYKMLLSILKKPKFISLDNLPKKSRVPDVINIGRKKKHVKKSKPKRVIKKCKCEK
jgi:hypothetical protein